MGLIGNSCSNQDLEEKETNVGEVQVTAGIAKSRVNFTETENITYANWENGDGITLSTPTQENLNYTAFVSESDATNATFTPEGKSLKDIDGETVYACYPAASITDGVVTLPATNVWTDTKPLPFAYAVSSIADSKVNLSFDYIHAFLKLTLSARALEKATSTDGEISVHRLLVKSASESLGVVSGNFNFEDNSSTITEGSTEVELTLTEAFQPSAETERSVYIPILPQTGNVSITIQLLHDYDGGQDVLMEMNKLTPTNGFASGHVYTLTLSGNSSCVIDGDSGEIHLAEAGLLSKFITTDNKNTIKSLKISGYLNGDDIKLLREMAGRDYTGEETSGSLTSIDFSEAIIMEGGGAYRHYEHKTENNIFGKYFFENTKLKDVLLPQNIISIGKYAFANCKELKQIIIPNSVQTIDREAFSNCKSLTNVTFKEGLTSIGLGAFSGCNQLSEISIPNSVKHIENGAFSNCESLLTINLEEGLEGIGGSAFAYCQVNELILPNSLKILGNGAFEKCTALSNVSFGENIVKIGDNAFISCTHLSEVTFPENTRLDSIGNKAFAYCNTLNNITIPKTVTDIGESAFRDCKSLPHIIIPDNVIKIQEFTFLNCIALSKVEIGSGITAIGKSAFNNCQALSDIFLPEGMREIETSVFSGCTALKSVIMSDSINSIGEVAFYDCSSLKSIVMPSALTTICDGAFARCKSLSEISFGNKLTTIGDEVFKYCHKLKEINIPTSITSMGCGVFYECVSLVSAKNVILDKSGGNGDMGGVYGGAMFGYCSSLESVAINEKTKFIGDNAFYGCQSLESIVIPENIKSIGHRSFYGCNSLNSVEFPTTITSIGIEAFKHCSSLKNIVLPAKITTINTNTFEDCSSLTSINIPNAVTAINEDAFSGCTSLSNLKIGKNVTAIQAKAFHNSPIVECLIYSATPSSIQNSTFSAIDAATAKLYVPKGSLTAYQESDWATFFNNIIEMDE